jgi:hypothetical protein
MFSSVVVLLETEFLLFGRCQRGRHVILILRNFCAEYACNQTQRREIFSDILKHKRNRLNYKGTVKINMLFYWEIVILM